MQEQFRDPHATCTPSSMLTRHAMWASLRRRKWVYQPLLSLAKVGATYADF